MSFIFPQLKKIWINDWTTDLIILTSLMLVFYFFCLSSYPVFIPDEGRYSEVAREMMVSGDYITPRVNGVVFLDKPILYYWLQAFAMYLFGIKEWALRLFPVLLGVFGCVMTYICGRLLFDRRTGLMSAIILATSPLYFSGSHYANLDLEVAVWISSSLLCFITGVESQGKSRLLFLFAAYLFAAFAFLTKGLIGIVFPASIIGSWIMLQRRFNLLMQIYLIEGLLLIAVIVLPWVYLVQKANPQFFHYFFVTQQISRFLSITTFNNPAPFWFYFPIIFLGFLPWTSFLMQALRSSISRINNPKESYLLLWLFIILTFFSIPHSKIITYILPIFPVLALITGNYLSRNSLSNIEHAIYYNTISFFIITLSFALIVFTTSLDWIKHPPEWNFYLHLVAIVYLLTSLFSFIFLFLLKKRNHFLLFKTAVFCNIIILLITIFGAKSLIKETTSPLTTSLKSILKPEDEVVNYFKFYQDVPLYLERYISIVADWNSSKIPDDDNWLRELWYGMPYQKTDNLLINEKEFWKKWDSNKRVFVFLNKIYINRFKRHGVYYFLNQSKHILLLSNKRLTSHPTRVATGDG